MNEKGHYSPQMSISTFATKTIAAERSPLADSRDVAATFGKLHHHVLAAIRNLNCSDFFSQTNFRFAVFLDDGVTT